MVVREDARWVQRRSTEPLFCNDAGYSTTLTLTPNSPPAKHRDPSTSWHLIRPSGYSIQNCTLYYLQQATVSHFPGTFPLYPSSAQPTARYLTLTAIPLLCNHLTTPHPRSTTPLHHITAHQHLVVSPPRSSVLEASSLVFSPVEC